PVLGRDVGHAAPKRRKIHCTRLKSTWSIRNRYNPKNADVRMTTTVVAYTSFLEGQVTRLSSLRTSVRNSRARSNQRPAVSRTLSIAVGVVVEFAAIGLRASTPCAVRGRPGGNRTPNPRFWRPVLCQLSYWPLFTAFRFASLTVTPLRFRPRRALHS